MKGRKEGGREKYERESKKNVTKEGKKGERKEGSPSL